MELTKELNNVSKACKIIGYSRQTFYEIRMNSQTYGSERLLDKLPETREAHPKRVSGEIKQAILDHLLINPYPEMSESGPATQSSGIQCEFRRSSRTLVDEHAFNQTSSVNEA